MNLKNKNYEFTICSSCVKSRYLLLSYSVAIFLGTPLKLVLAQARYDNNKRLSNLYSNILYIFLYILFCRDVINTLLR